MNNWRMGVFGRRSACALASCLIPWAAQAQAPAPTGPEHLSWYADPTAPNLSGLWVRAEATGAGGSASKSKEGWLPWPPPLKGSFAATWKKRVADAEAGKRTDDPIRGCLPPGMPRLMSGANGPLLILQTPGRVMIYRDGAPIRRIWLDGRQNPKAADLEDFSNGNAIGHYEGADLVTEVVGLNDEPIDSTGVPHSEKLKIVEHLHRLDEQTLKVDIILTDAEAYSRPMTTTIIYKALNDPLWEPKEFVCTPGANYHPDMYIH